MSASARAATIVASGVARWCALAPAVRVARRIVPAIALALGLATVPALAGAASYGYTTEPYAWVPTTGATTVTWSRTAQCSGGGAAVDDDITAELPIGFTYVFGTTSYTTVRIMSNGRLQFNNNFCGHGTQTTSPVTYPYNYPGANVARTMRVYGADFDTSIGGVVTYATLGSAPNRRFVATWSNISEWNQTTDSRFNVQIILEESGDFIYQWGASNNTSGGKAQIGWELTTADYGLVTFTNIGSLVGTAVRFKSIASSTPPRGFNVFDTGTASGAVTGVLQTKVAGQSFAVDVVAINSGGTGVLTTFVGSVTLELLNSSDNGGALNATTGCRSSWTTAQSLGTQAFVAASAGRIRVSGIVEPEAWRDARFRVTYTPATGSAIVGCSTDNFAIRPASFTTPVATDGDWQTTGTARMLSNTSASGGVVHAAGQPFRITMTALNAAGVTTAGYTGAPQMIFDGCVVPSPCTTASVANLVAPFTSASGVATSAGAFFTEVGAFRTHAEDTTFASVDASDGTPAAQRLISSPATSIGRFVPARFLLTLSRTPSFTPGQSTACTTRADWNFTWIGQAFAWATTPVVTLTAQASDGQTTRQYAGTLFKLAASAIVPTWGSNAPASAPFSATGQTVAVASSGSGLGSATFGSAASFVFTRPATPVAPFNAVISLTVDVSDASEAGTTGNGTIGALAALVINGGGAGIAFTGTNAQGANAQLYGRLQVSSAHGDSRRALWMPYETQAWSGGAWYRNHRDSCATPPASAIAMSNWGGALAACDVSVSAVTQASKGQGWIQLTAPASAKTGGLDVALRLGAASGSRCAAGASVASGSAGLPWLQGPWTSAPNYTSDPAGRASFGSLRVDSLIRRELF